MTASSLAPFAQALLDPQRPCPPGLRAWNGADPAPRFAVHRNNVVTSLVAALADTCPVLRELVGGEFFDAMARLYVLRHPPASPVLAEYGEGFADFIETFEPARTLPYLADMARLEWLRLRAWHAADEPPLTAAHLATRLADPAALPLARLRLHPSAALLRSAHGVVSLWAAHQADEVDAALGAVDTARPENALVLRDGEDVLVLPLAAPDAACIAALAAGAALGEAVALGALAAADDADAAAFDAAALLALLIRHGALVAWLRPEAVR